MELGIFRQESDGVASIATKTNLGTRKSQDILHRREDDSRCDKPDDLMNTDDLTSFITPSFPLLYPINNDVIREYLTSLPVYADTPAGVVLSGKRAYPSLSSLNLSSSSPSQHFKQLSTTPFHNTCSISSLQDLRYSLTLFGS